MRTPSCNTRYHQGFGAKSIGEVVINTPLPAVTDALSHAAGKRFYELPITPEQIAMARAENN